ncbi:hypothetical protein [Haliscomenobacter sp.]|uniref:hypothetical protein n=1 Tax=Haliscomenobacter sp. TaxID=2717303 RepID=UPI003593865F
MLELIPIQQTLAENQELAEKPECLEILTMTIDHYKIIGFVPPWIGFNKKQLNYMLPIV